MTLGNRIVLTIVIVLIILLALAFTGWLTGRWEVDEAGSPIWQTASAQSQPELCMDEKTRELVRGIVLEALDNALRARTERLYDVWMKDDTGQPTRASRGVEQGIRAYVHARTSAMGWNPPTCS